MTSRNRAVGAALIVVSSVGFASLPIFGKLAYASGTQPMALLAWRFGIAASIMLIAAAVRGRATGQPILPPLRMSITLLLVGAFLLTPEVMLYFVGLQSVSAGLAETLLFLYPAWVVLIGATVFRQRPSAVTVGCVIVAVIGAAVTVGAVSGGSLTGELMVIAASALFATYVVVASRLIPKAGTLRGTALVMTGATCTFTVVALVTSAQGPSDRQGWFGVLGMALFGTVLAFGLLSAGLGRLPAGTAAVISTVEPVVAVILGAVVLGEAVGPLQVVGMVLIVGAVAVLLRYESRPASAAGDEPLVNPVVLSE